MPEPGQEETVRIVALDRSFHIGCYKCEVRGLGNSWGRERVAGVQGAGCGKACWRRISGVQA